MRHLHLLLVKFCLIVAFLSEQQIIFYSTTLQGFVTLGELSPNKKINLLGTPFFTSVLLNNSC